MITDARVVRRLSRHVASCVSCSRYDQSLRKGIQALRTASVDIEPTPQFRERLRQRIEAGAEPGVPVTPAAAGVATLLMLAAALALIIHQRSATQPANPVPAVAAAPAPAKPQVVEEPTPDPVIVVNPSAPFVTFTDLSVSAFHGPATYNSPNNGSIDSWANLPR